MKKPILWLLFFAIQSAVLARVNPVTCLHDNLTLVAKKKKNGSDIYIGNCLGRSCAWALRGTWLWLSPMSVNQVSHLLFSCLWRTSTMWNHLDLYLFTVWWCLIFLIHSSDLQWIVLATSACLILMLCPQQLAGCLLEHLLNQVD